MAVHVWYNPTAEFGFLNPHHATGSEAVCLLNHASTQTHGYTNLQDRITSFGTENKT